MGRLFGSPCFWNSIVETLVFSKTRTPQEAACLRRIWSNSDRDFIKTCECPSGHLWELTTHNIPGPKFGPTVNEVGIPFPFMLVEFDCRTRLIYISPPCLCNDSQAPTLGENPCSMTFFSAPTNCRSGRMEGNKLSPIWYLGNLSASNSVTSKPSLASDAAAKLPPGPPPITRIWVCVGLKSYRSISVIERYSRTHNFWHILIWLYKRFR